MRYDAFSRTVGENESLTFSNESTLNRASQRQLVVGTDGAVLEEVDATTHQPTQTYVWGPAGLVFRQAADGSRRYAHATPDGSVTAVVDPATHLPAARYVYTPTGVAKMVSATGSVAAGSSSLTDISLDSLDWKYLWHGQRFLLGDRLYHLNGGTGYDPFIGSTITSMHGTYTSTTDPQDPGPPPEEWVWQTWWDQHGKDFLREVGQKLAVAGAIAAVSVATAGAGATLAAGLIGAGLGGVDAALGGGNVAEGMSNGAMMGMAVAGGGGLVSSVFGKTAAYWGGVGLNAAATGYGTYESLNNGNALQGTFRTMTGLAFGALQAREAGWSLGFDGSTMGTAGGNVRITRASPPAREQMLFEFADPPATSSQSTTRLGVPRDQAADWRAWRDSWDAFGYGEILSPANRQNIATGLRPTVDQAWIVAFPGDAPLAGEIITPHHIGGSPITVPLPTSRHLAAHMPGGFKFNPGGPGQTG